MRRAQLPITLICNIHNFIFKVMSLIYWGWLYTEDMTLDMRICRSKIEVRLVGIRLLSYFSYDYTHTKDMILDTIITCCFLYFNYRIMCCWYCSLFHYFQHDRFTLLHLSFHTWFNKLINELKIYGKQSFYHCKIRVELHTRHPFQTWLVKLH